MSDLCAATHSRRKGSVRWSPAICVDRRARSDAIPDYGRYFETFVKRCAIFRQPSWARGLFRPLIEALVPPHPVALPGEPRDKPREHT
jgi:hypothetical protein